MKRLNSSDSFTAFMSICPNSTDEHNDNNEGNNPMYTRDFQSMMDGYDDEESAGQLVSEKKRRLRVDQVKALEKNFEKENKLEPERKVKLAQELGLQPRQVAVWFQNRRARWKTKQLERDYGVLKANYDALKCNCDTLRRDNDTLLKEIQELKSKLNKDDKTNSKLPVKEEPLSSDSEDKTNPESPLDSPEPKSDEAEAETELIFENCNGAAFVNFGDLKDGSSDSDSSAILNEDNNNSNSPIRFLDIHSTSGSSSSSKNISSFKFSGSKANAAGVSGDGNKAATSSYQFVKIEEHNFFGEESCSRLFSDDQAPTLHWYSSDEWN